MISVMTEYNLIRSNRKTISLQIDKNLQITIKAPIKMPVRDIEAFINKNSGWIEKHKTQMEQQNKLQAENALTEERKSQLKQTARKILPQKVQEFSRVMGVIPTDVKITSAHARWGSCNSKNSLCFSYRLMLLPDELIDIIVVHELAHIKVKNHSADFYREVTKYMPDYRERHKKLRLIQGELPN